MVLMKIAKVEFQNSARPESNEVRLMGGFTLYNMVTKVTMSGYHGDHGWLLWLPFTCIVM